MGRLRRIVNITLLSTVVTLGGVVAWRRLSAPQSHTPVGMVAEDAAPGSSDIPETALRDTTYVESPTSSEPHDASAPVDNPDVTRENAAATVADMAVTTSFHDTDLRKMIRNHPFAGEAVKVISGRLQADDSVARSRILNYCEHFRMAYDTKDIDFLRQVFSENALIIVGHTVKTAQRLDAGGSDSEKVRFSVRSKPEYLSRLERVFAANDSIRLRFSDFKIMRHPTSPGIYGVTLRQRYSSDNYSDDGWLFLLWDFRDRAMPRIHVRTWQPGRSVADADDVIGIGDFNIE